MISFRVLLTPSAGCGARFRRSAHVTPKSYLSFLNSYKTVYRNKSAEIGEMAERMSSGLTKLHEASLTVEALKRELVVTETELAQASDKAEKVRQDAQTRAGGVPARSPIRPNR